MKFPSRVWAIVQAIALVALLGIPADAQVAPQWQCGGTPVGAVSRVNVTGGCCAYASGVYTITCGGGGGAGTVTSLAAGTNITLTPNPITTTGTIAVTNNSTTVNGELCALGGSCNISTAPSGAAGGDLAGTYPNPTVAKYTATGASVCSGTASFDNSGCSGVFKTSTGAVTIGPAAIGLTGNVTLTSGLTFLSGAATLIGAVADRLNAINLAFAGQAVGDQWVADSTTTGTRVAIGSLGRVWASNGTTAYWSDVITVRSDLTPGTTGTVDTTVITFPAGLGTNTNGILVSDLTVRVRQAIVSSGGDGQTVLTVGTAAAGTQYLATATITSATAAGTIYGLDTTTVGSAFTVANMYNALAAGSSTIVVRTVTTGDVDTPALLTLHFNSEVL